MNKHLKLFANHSAYSQAESNLDRPNVALCLLEGDVHYNPYVDPYNGHAYVDLGLPSGTLWATMNVGATSATDYGNYYMYGMGSNTYNRRDTLYEGTEDPLALNADTAAQEWGGQWHMPTQTQMQELRANTTYQWVTDYNDSGINGGLFTASNGKSVFFPAAGKYLNGNQRGADVYGYYWSSSPNGSEHAYHLTFGSGSNSVSDVSRLNGFSVRPVIG